MFFKNKKPNMNAKYINLLVDSISKNREKVGLSVVYYGFM